MQTASKKVINGWAMYDWANSAFFTVVVGVLVGPYLLSLAERAVGAEGDAGTAADAP